MPRDEDGQVVVAKGLPSLDHQPPFELHRHLPLAPQLLDGLAHCKVPSLSSLWYDRLLGLETFPGHPRVLADHLQLVDDEVAH